MSQSLMINENRDSSFWAMRQSMCVIVVSPPTLGAGAIGSEKWENHKNSANSTINF